MSDSLELHEEQLRIGIPMMLGHSVVLLLKLCAVTRREAQVPGPWDELLGSGQSMRELRAQLALASACDLDVLLRGETGTGKELAARAIHQGSGRSGAPLVSVNMAAIPEELAPAALFGSARGSFTGADKSVSGYFQQADGGSLFLDEVGEAASAVQPQLLRALQQRDVQVVGGAIRKVDVRVISATDADLDSNEVAFRAALRHRLGSIEIDMPPLRDRLEDIGELMRHFMLCTASGESREDILPTPCSEPRNVAAWANLFFIFARYNWPGNVRELANSVRQVVLSAVDIPVLPAKFEVLLSRTSMPATAHAGVRDRKIADVDDAEFERAMMDNDYEVRRVALELGVSRASVYRRIESSARYRLATDIPLADLLHELAAHGGDVEAAARELRVSSRSLGQRLGKETAGRA